jgi:hypothetical protein
MGKVLKGGSKLNDFGVVADAGLIGTSTLRKRVIHGGVMTLLSTCISAALRSGLEALIRTTETRTDSCAQPVANPHLFFVALLEGAESVGLQRLLDPNGRMMESSGEWVLLDETVRAGKRLSIYHPYSESILEP